MQGLKVIWPVIGFSRSIEGCGAAPVRLSVTLGLSFSSNMSAHM